MRRTGNLTLCGKQAIKTREATTPPGWHLACVSCLAIINNQKEKTE